MHRPGPAAWLGRSGRGEVPTELVGNGAVQGSLKVAMKVAMQVAWQVSVKVARSALGAGNGTVTPFTWLIS